MRKNTVGLEVNDRKLGVNFYTSSSRRGILFVHGYDSNQQDCAEYARKVAQEKKGNCLVFDLGGHGSSDGDRNELTINEHLAEVKDAYTFLASRTLVNQERIGVVGESYGGYLAILLSAEYPVKSLMLRAPALYPNGMEDTPRKDYDMKSIDYFRRNLNPRLENRALEAISSFAGTIALVGSEFDESLPSNVIDAYSSAAQRSTVVKIPGARHSLEGQEREIFMQLIVNFAKGL